MSRQTSRRCCRRLSWTHSHSSLPRQRLRVTRRMPYRLPLELEFTILELAAPPLAFDGLHDRVDFFINASLVHRSLTPWAQERLHDQFLYTYQPRPDEHERLKTRLEAGFGRDLPLRRLYLDLRCLPSDISSEYGTDSASATIQGRVYEAVSLTDEAGHGGEGGTSGEQRASDAVARFLHAEDADPFLGHWHLCTIIAAYSQTIHVIWLKLPMMNLNVTNLPRASAVESPGRLLIDTDK